MALSILITVSADDTTHILDATDRAYGLAFGTNEHGFSALEFSYPCSLNSAFAVYDRIGASYIRVSDSGVIVWEGRVEDVAITDYGLRIKAFGFQRALSDVLYTAMWSMSLVQSFRPGIETEVNTSKPQLYIEDKQNRLQANLKKNGVYASGDDAFYWVYELPDDSATSATYAEASYDYNLPSNWTVQGLAYLSDWSSGVSSNITTSGSVGSGTFTWDLSGSPKQAIGFRMYNSSGSAYTNASEDDAFYFRITSPRITASGSSVTADEISGSLASYVNGINSSQLSNSTILIESPGVDLAQEVYEDQTPADILSRLSKIGDTSGNVWEWGVYEGQRLHFRARGSAGRAWYVDSASLSIEKTIDTLSNSVYAVYSQSDGRTLRTATSSSNYSAGINGIVKQAAVSANTTGSASAVYARDTALTDGASPSPRIAILFREVYGADGARWKLWNVRSGDTITIRNLPPTISVDIDRIRTFRVSETTYRADDDALEVIPETPPPMLDVLVARRAAGVF